MFWCKICEWNSWLVAIQSSSFCEIQWKLYNVRSCFECMDQKAKLFVKPMYHEKHLIIVMWNFIHKNPIIGHLNLNSFWCKIGEGISVVIKNPKKFIFREPVEVVGCHHIFWVWCIKILNWFFSFVKPIFFYHEKHLIIVSEEFHSQNGNQLNIIMMNLMENLCVNFLTNWNSFWPTLNGLMQNLWVKFPVNWISKQLICCSPMEAVESEHWCDSLIGKQVYLEDYLE